MATVDSECADVLAPMFSHQRPSLSVDKLSEVRILTKHPGTYYNRKSSIFCIFSVYTTTILRRSCSLVYV